MSRYLFNMNDEHLEADEIPITNIEFGQTKSNSHRRRSDSEYIRIKNPLMILLHLCSTNPRDQKCGFELGIWRIWKSWVHINIPITVELMIGNWWNRNSVPKSGQFGPWSKQTSPTVKSVQSNSNSNRSIHGPNGKPKFRSAEQKLVFETRRTASRFIWMHIWYGLAFDRWERCLMRFLDLFPLECPLQWNWALPAIVGSSRPWRINARINGVANECFEDSVSQAILLTRIAEDRDGHKNMWRTGEISANTKKQQHKTFKRLPASLRLSDAVCGQRLVFESWISSFHMGIRNTGVLIYHCQADATTWRFLYKCDEMLLSSSPYLDLASGLILVTQSSNISEQMNGRNRSMRWWPEIGFVYQWTSEASYRNHNLAVDNNCQAHENWQGARAY